MKKLPTDRCGQLNNVLFLARDAKVTLTFNLSPELGLANGSTGKVKDVIYLEGTKPVDQPPRPSEVDLPYCVWVEFDEYCGPSFFPQDSGRNKWVPIYPRRHMELRKKRNNWVEEERIMIPLRLAWAWTIHKAQGQTIRSKIVLNLGRKEMDHGLTYVAISRATKIGSIGITGGVTRERITSQLANMKKVKFRKREDTRLAALAEETYNRLRNR